MNQNNNVKNNNNANRKEKEYSIEIEQREFTGVQKSELTTLIDLSKLISSIFRPVFADFEGCLINVNQQGALMCELYFKYTGNQDPNKYNALARKSDMVRNTSNPMDMINNLNNRNSNKQFVLTQPAKDILSEFLYGSVMKNGTVNWEKDNHGIVVERTQRTNQMYNSYVSLVQINYIDITKILRKYYGRKDGDSRLEYTVTPIKELPSFDGRIRNMLVNVTQVSSKEVEKLVEKLGGFTPTRDSIPMIR